MVVEVVAGQVGHYRDIELQRSDTALFQGMGGNLHGHRLGAAFFQVVQGRLHGDRVWRGQAAALQLAMEAGAQSADQAAALAKRIERLCHQLGNAGLAIGTGHADQVQLAARLAIETAGDLRQLADQALDRNQRHVGQRQHVGAQLFVRNSSSTARQGIGDMLAAIDLGAGYRQEQIALTHGAAVQSQLTNQRIAAGVGEKLAQWHCHHPRPPLAGAAFTCC